MTARAARKLRPRPGRWVRVERTRGSGECCAVCEKTVERGYAFFESPTLSTAFLCDLCVAILVSGDDE